MKVEAPGADCGAPVRGLARIVLGSVFLSVLLGGAGCQQPAAVLVSVTADAPVEQYDLYVRDDATGQVIFHSGFQPVQGAQAGQAGAAAPKDLTTDPLKIALKLSRGGRFTLLLVGVIGEVQGARPAETATQLFWAGRVQVDGTEELSARLLTVPPGDDGDRDLWPDAADFPAHVAEAAALYREHRDLLDCNDKSDNPLGPAGEPLKLRAEAINPFAVEICGDGYDENCSGDGDEVCVDEDGDGDPRGVDCDDQDPARHHPSAADPFPDPPNCCGYSLGKLGTAEERVDFSGDPSLCPTSRCGDGVDQGCRGATNDPANDTRCVVDGDCDTFPLLDDGSGDCDDQDPAIHPGALEICNNGIDENCNGVPDDGCVPCDLDGDGYQRNDAPNGCPDQSDKHPGVFDCNDDDAGVFPGQTQGFGGKEGGATPLDKVRSALRGDCRRYYEPKGAGTAKISAAGQLAGDADCNGLAYEGCPAPECDADGDGWPNGGAGCNPSGGALDCDDADPTVFPSAPDKCDTPQAEDCSASTACASDADGDGYNAGAGDCDDTNAGVHPWALELCNGVDDDCDGLIDEGNPDPSGQALVNAGQVTQCTDDDDGECGKLKGRCVCSAAQPKATQDPGGKRVACPGELGGAAKPPRCFGAGQPRPQTCDSNPATQKDEDCDGALDDPTGKNLAEKGMPCGVSQGQCRAGVVIGCDQSASNPFAQFGRIASDKSWLLCSVDAVYPKLEECNGLDDDCDAALPPGEQDLDDDKYLACAGCGAVLAAGKLGCNDCDDAVASVHPNAMEKCNNVDDNCSLGVSDDGKDECNGATPTCCSGQAACRNTTMGDVNNCGACGSVCDPIRANACGGSSCLCGSAAACAGASYCNGGSCAPCSVTARCGPSCMPCGANQVCKTDGSGCTGCNGDGDCAADKYCSGGNCLARVARGLACGADNQCLQSPGPSYCTDGVCCDQPASMCNGCRYCKRAGQEGSCGVAAGADPHSVCTYSKAGCTQAVCNAAGTCAAADATVCVDPSCAAGATNQSTCQGGVCTASTPVLCSPYTCNGGGTGCRTSCSSNTHCATGYYCRGSDSSCQPTVPQGQPCTSTVMCQGGLSCVDMVCCGVAACGSCQTCNGSAMKGSCTAITGADDPNSCTDNLPTAGSSFTCNGVGQCLLELGQVCAAPGECASNLCDVRCCATACMPDTCGGSPPQQTIYSCDGAGACGSVVSSCGSYACNAGATACRTTCASDADCAAGRWCKKGAMGGPNTCEMPITSGQACSDSSCAAAGCNQCAGAQQCPGGNGKSCP